MTAEHRIRWYGIGDGGTRIPRNVHMSGADWGWDAECSCGWESRTGGAIQEEIRRKIADHRFQAAYCEQHGHLARGDSGPIDLQDKCSSCGARRTAVNFRSGAAR